MKIQELIIQKIIKFLNIKIEDIAMGHEFFLPTGVLPKGFHYPASYKAFVKHELPDMEPWHFFHNKLEYRFNGLKKRYPTRILVPFARRGDNDDVACFDGSDLSEDPKVCITHDFASPGWEQRGELQNFLDWVKFAKEEAEEWTQFWINHQENDK